MVRAEVVIDQTIFKPANFSNFSSLINIFLPLITVFVSVIFLVMLIRAAITIISSSDNPEALKKAKQTLTTAIFGLIIVIGSFLAVNIIGRILGIDNLLRN